MEKIQGNGPTPEQALLFKLKREITVLFKSQLETMEDLTVEHDNAMQKLEEALPSQYKNYVGLADHLTDPKCDQIRKRILDKGNAAYKNIEEILKDFEIDFKYRKKE